MRVVILASLLTLLSFCAPAVQAETLTSKKQVYDINATLISGEQFTYSTSQINKPLVMFFSGSLCPLPHLPNCEVEIAKFNELHKKYNDDFVWVQVVKGYYSNEVLVKNYLNKFGINVSTIFDTNNTVFQQFNVHAMPYVVIVDNGTISYRKDDFIQDIEAHLIDKLAL